MATLDIAALNRTEGPIMFVVGSGRSGTSLLASMLDAHPDLLVARESHFLPKLIAELPETLTKPSDVELMAALLRSDKWFVDWDFDLDLLRQALSTELPLIRPDALRMIYRVQAAMAGKRRFGEKTPAYVYRIPLLAAEIADARFIHIVRDGRNVALSLRDAPFGDDRLEHNALTWQLRVLGGRASGAKLGRDRYIELRYEDLIVDSEAQLHRLCSFLDLPYSPRMLTYYQRTSMRSSVGKSSGNLHRPPTTTRDWREQLTSEEHARLELLAGKALRTWGYNLTSNPTTADRSAAYRSRVQWWFYRLRSKSGLARRRRSVSGRKGDHKLEPRT